MKQSNIHIKTLRQSPFEGEMQTQHLMFRAGMLKKNGIGDYTLMPYGYALYKIIENKLTSLLSHSAFQEVSTLNYDAKELLTQLRSDIVSYKDLPLYIQSNGLKRRHNYSVKLGLIKSKSTPIKGFQLISHSDIDFQEKKSALWRELFEFGQELNISFEKSLLISSNTETSKEGYWVPSEYGDEVFYQCDTCDYCSDQHNASWMIGKVLATTDETPEEIHTPNIKTIADLERFMSINAKTLLKTLLVQVPLHGKLKTVAIVLSGNRELNIKKVARFFSVLPHEINLVNDLDVLNAAGTTVGFAGPIGLKNVIILADEEVTKGQAMVTGANRVDYHLKNVVYGRDYKAHHVGNFSYILSGDICCKCGGNITAREGYVVVELTSYKKVLSENMDIKYKDNQMKEQRPIVELGSIDMYRLLTTYLDHNKDDDGFVLKKDASVFDVHVLVPNIRKEEQMQLAKQLSKKLEIKEFKVLIDDRKGSTGSKFKDSDLLGIPVRITTGKLAGDGIVELKYRNSKERLELSVEEALTEVKKSV